jgi:disulfide bond formation protein DsbB
MCWKCTDPNEACGWPPRTVRALLAVISLIFVFGICTVSIILLLINQQYQSAIGIIAALTGIIGSIIGYYFGMHTATSASTSASASTTSDVETPLKMLSENEPNGLTGISTEMHTFN